MAIAFPPVRFTALMHHAPTSPLQNPSDVQTLFQQAFAPRGTPAVPAALDRTRPRVLFDHYASVGNVGTGEDTLYTDTLAANQLAGNGEKLQIEYGGTFVSSGTATREIKVYFGGTVMLDTGALTLGLSSAWTIYAMVIRVSATVVRYFVSLTTEGAALAAYTATGEITGLTLSNTQIVKITGEAAGVGTADNDIVAMLGSITWIPAGGG